MSHTSGQHWLYRPVLCFPLVLCIDWLLAAHATVDLAGAKSSKSSEPFAALFPVVTTTTDTWIVKDRNELGKIGPVFLPLRILITWTGWAPGHDCGNYLGYVN